MMKNAQPPTELAIQARWRRRRSTVATASASVRRNDVRPCESAIWPPYPPRGDGRHSDTPAPEPYRPAPGSSLLSYDAAGLGGRFSRLLSFIHAEKASHCS